MSSDTIPTSIVSQLKIVLRTKNPLPEEGAVFYVN